MTPLPKGLANYQSKIVPDFADKNKALLAGYEQEKKKAQEEYEREKAAYPALVKAAEDQYAKEMEAYNKKSFGEKVVEKKVLGEDTRPVKRLPSTPYLREVEKPNLQTTYDYPVMANTYLYLAGFENKPANAVNIVVTLYGFDYTQPQTLSEQKTVSNLGNGGQTSSVTYYHTEFSYRQPLSIKVTTPDGKEVMNVTPPEFNNYKIYKSAESTTSPQVNSELLIKTNEEKNMQDNLRAANELINDKFGYAKIKRKAVIYYVKSKGGEYADLMTAYNDMSSGLKILTDDKATAQTKITAAVENWEKALLESDPANKKARIDKDVTIAIYYNLLEAYFALRVPESGLEAIQKLNAMDLSTKQRKRKDEFEAAFNDLKKRMQTNQ